MSIGSIGATLFGSAGRTAVSVVLVVAIALGGAFFAGVIGAPSVTGVDNAFGDVNESTTVIKSDLQVNNPNPVGGSLGGVTVNYTVEMNDVQMATGTKRGVQLPAGNSTLPFTTYMSNEKIPPWWVSHVRNGEETTLNISADVHSSLLGKSFSAPKVTREVDTNIIGAFNSSETRPMNANREPVVQDPVMYLNSTSATWGNTTSERTNIQMTFVVYNPKSYPITVSKIGYDIGMNNISVGEGATEKSYVIPAKSTRTINATTTIDNQKLDEWWVSHLERNQVTRLRISFYMEFDLSAGPTQASNVRIPLDDLTDTIETDMFGNKGDEAASGSGDGANGSDETGNESENGTATPTETETADGDAGDETETATPTETETATPTDSTATDDGGVLRLRAI